LQRFEVAHVRDGELVHQDAAARCDDPFSGCLEVVDAEGALETAGRFSIEEPATLLNRAQRRESSSR